MKQYAKCGAFFSDDKGFCLDCGARLGASLPPEEEKRFSEQAARQIDSAAEGLDGLRVSAKERIVGIALLVLAPLSLTLAFLAGNETDAPVYFFLVCPLALVIGLNALFPKLAGAMEKFWLKMRIDNAEDATPSDLYVISRKIAVYVCAAIIFALFVFGLCHQFLPDDPSENVRFVTFS